MSKNKLVSLLLLFATLVCASSANADFIGSYDVSNWTTTVTPFGSDGSVDISAAPLSITLTSGNNAGLIGFASTLDFTIPVVVNSTIFFQWDYHTLDIDPILDPFGYLLNGAFTDLTTSGAIFNPISGTFLPQIAVNTLLNVNAGDIFGFRARSEESRDGAGITTVRLFTATPTAVPVPEPATLGLLIMGSIGLLVNDRRRKQQTVSV